MCVYGTTRGGGLRVYAIIYYIISAGELFHKRHRLVEIICGGKNRAPPTHNELDAHIYIRSRNSAAARALWYDHITYNNIQTHIYIYIYIHDTYNMRAGFFPLSPFTVYYNTHTLARAGSTTRRPTVFWTVQIIHSNFFFHTHNYKSARAGWRRIIL